MGRALHAGTPRHGGAHDDGRTRRVRAFTPTHRRCPQQGGPRAATYDAGPQARPSDRRRRARARQARVGGRGGMLDWRHRRPHRGRHAHRSCHPRAAPGCPKSSSRARRFQRRASACRACPARCRRCCELFGDAARWRHRIRQDRGLLRSRGAHAGARAAGAYHAAGDCAHQPIHGPLCRALWLCARGMALRALARRTRPRLARDGQRPSACGGGGSLRSLPALSGSGAHRH
jgi:hypothetical protein